MNEETEGPEPQGQSEVQDAEVGEPERGGEESVGERPDLDARQERIRTERKPAGPPLREEEELEADGDETDPPDVDPEDEA
jgi:hypothetical protein